MCALGRGSASESTPAATATAPATPTPTATATTTTTTTATPTATTTATAIATATGTCGPSTHSGARGSEATRRSFRGSGGGECPRASAVREPEAFDLPVLHILAAVDVQLGARDPDALAAEEADQPRHFVGVAE